MYFDDYLGGQTLHVSYEENVRIITEESWDSNAAEGMRQLQWMACTQASWFQTSGSLQAPATNFFDRSLFIQTCVDVFGESYNDAFIDAVNNYINTAYLGAKPNVENVYFSYGSQDPSRFLGPDGLLNPSIEVDVIPGVGRYSNLYNSRYVTIPEVKAAQARVREIIIEWWS